MFPPRAMALGGDSDVLIFPPASAPEVMRAAEKDDQYASFVCEACYDAFRHVLGSRVAVAYQNETKVAGRALYYLLTTGSGIQTLGEEYCDILQVASATGLPPSPARRMLLVFYQAILPYLGERLSSRAAARGIILADEDDSSATGERPQQSELVTGACKRLQRVIHGLQRLWNISLRRWAVVFPAAREAALLVARANLMLFYFEGMYYHLAKRTAKVRYIYMGKASQQRSRYQMLGVFLLIQVFILGAHWLRRSMWPAVAFSIESRRQSHTYQGRRGVAILDEDGKRVQPKSPTSPLESVAFGKCPLCLSPRQSPTATPCGHVFCWVCVAEWCNEKPECPLCRAPVAHTELVCVYHSDF